MGIAKLSFLVRDYDEAVAWFTRCLGFTLVEDVKLGGDKRWVVVRPPGHDGAALLLAKAATSEQKVAIGDQAGGRVFLFLETTDFAAQHALMQREGVTFLEQPREEPYGTVAVFEDLFGNKWDLIQPKR